jgi:hypothetical protein
MAKHIRKSKKGGSEDKSIRPPKREWTDDKWPESMEDKAV